MKYVNIVGSLIMVGSMFSKLPQRFFSISIPLAILFLGIRFFLVNADIPSWKAFSYSQVDEAYYSMQALNLYKHSHINSAKYDGVLTTASTENLFSNLITTISLYLFGDNYYGLRLGHILFSLISFIIFLRLVYQSFSQTTEFWKTIITALIGLMYCLTAGLIWPNILNEPTGTRLNTLIIFIFFFVQLASKEHSDNQSSKDLALKSGLLAGFLSFFVYPTNFFILPATLVSVLLIKRINTGFDYKKAMPHCLFFFSGAALNAVLFFITRQLILTQGEAVMYSSFGDRILSFTPIENFKNLILASFMRDNLPFAVLAVLAVILLFFSFKNKNSQQIILTQLFLFFCFQILFLNDFSFRKTLVVIPILLLFIPYVYESLKHIQMNIEQYLLVLFTSVLLVGTIFLEYKKTLPNFEINLTLIAMLLMAICTTALLFFKAAIAEKSFVLLLSLCLVLAVKQTNLILASKTTVFETCLSTLSEIIPENSFVFGYSQGFWLYNKWTPIGNEYVYTYNHPAEKQESDADKLYSLHNGERPIYKITMQPSKDINVQRWEVTKDIDYCTENPYESKDNTHPKFFLLKYKNQAKN